MTEPSPAEQFADAISNHTNTDTSHELIDALAERVAANHATREEITNAFAEAVDTAFPDNLTYTFGE